MKTANNFFIFKAILYIILFSLHNTICDNLYSQVTDSIRCIPYPQAFGHIKGTSINGKDIWLVSKDKLIYKEDDKDFIDVSDPTEQYDQVFAAGVNDVWFHYYKKNEFCYKFRRIHNNEITIYPDPDNFALASIWINSPNDIWAVGIVGTLIHFDGYSWKKLPGLTNNHIVDISLDIFGNGYVLTENQIGIFENWKVRLDEGKISLINITYRSRTGIDIENRQVKIFPNGFWIRQNDSLVYISKDNSKKKYPLKLNNLNFIPQKTETFFNFNMNLGWSGYDQIKKSKFILFFNRRKSALKLFENGNLEFLKIKSQGLVIAEKFKERTIPGSGEYSAGFGVINDDPWLDIFVIVPEDENRLKLNNQEEFSDATFNYEVNEDQLSQDGLTYYDNGILIADFDNDNDQDLIITAHQGSNLFFVNKDKKFFINSTSHSHLYDEGYRNNMAIAGDVDNDGDLDLFITREYTSNILYLNDGYGRFTDVTLEANLISERGGMGCAFSDIDSDGDLDIFVANWRIRNQLYRNDGVDKITGIPLYIDVSDSAGIVNDNSKRSNVAIFADVDNDGDPDLYIVNRSDHNRLYLNDGQGYFYADTINTDLNQRSGVCNSALFFDADNDGNLDLALTLNGANLFFRNLGNARFRDETAGFGFNVRNDTKSIICGDVDLDGDIDLYVTSAAARSNTYINQLNDNRFIKLHLTGYLSNRDAVGAKVYFYEGGHLGESMFSLGLRTVEAGSGLASTNSKIIHFGTGEYKFIDLRIKFPSGVIINRQNVKPGSSLRIEELQGREKYSSTFEMWLKSIFHSVEFKIEFVVYLIFIICLLFIFPRVFNLNITLFSWYLVSPFLVLVVFRMLLDNNNLWIRLAIAIISGLSTYFFLLLNIRHKLKQKEIDDITDELRQKLIQFHHGDWARSNINQLMFLTQNINKDNQHQKELREKLLNSINSFIQFTNPAIIRISKLAQNTKVEKGLSEKIDHTTTKIYKSLEKHKNIIQLAERLNERDLARLSDDIQYLKLYIDQLNSEIEKKYKCFLTVFFTEWIKTTTQTKQIKIQLKMAAFADLEVRIKPTELMPVVDNIVKNAISATLDKPIPELEIYGERKGHMLLLHFIDNGCGIPTDKLADVFTEGYTTSEKKGKGRGLFFSQRILKKYGGDIYVNSSKLNEGADIVLKFAIID